MDSRLNLQQLLLKAVQRYSEELRMCVLAAVHRGRSRVVSVPRAAQRLLRAADELVRRMGEHAHH